MNRTFEMDDRGEMHYLLGMEISRDREERKLWIGQQRQAEKVLERFEMVDCKPVATPMVPELRLEPASEAEIKLHQALPYREAVGSLMYMALGTRPDIAQAVSYLSCFNSCYALEHWQAVKHLLRYLQGTRNARLEFGRTQEGLVGYADSDYAGCTTTRKSTTGFIFTYQGCALTWKSKQQATVSKSTTEAEYIASSTAVNDAVWLKRLFCEFGHDLATIPLKGNNQGSLDLIANPVFHS